MFGDNTLRRGLGGAAKLRYHPQSYGFITKKLPSYTEDSFYTPEEYVIVYKQEIEKLLLRIQKEPTKHFLISKLGAGLANRHLIFEKVIEPRIKIDLAGENVTFLWQ